MIDALRLALACGLLLACAPAPSPADASPDAASPGDRAPPTEDRPPVDRPDPRAAWWDVPRDREDGAAPRCYGVDAPAGLLTHVGSIPRESGGLSNGASGCVGDVDNDGRREYVLPRLSEPSELIGDDLCARGRVLLPEYARDCIVADLDGAPGNELVVISSEGWTRASRVAVGRIVVAAASDRTAERYAWRELTALDDVRPVSPVGAPHAAAVDLERDGRRELVVSGNHPAPFVRVWSHEMGRWSSRFGQDLAGVTDDTNGVLVGDLDADGDDDALLLGGCSGLAGRHLLRTFQRWDAQGFDDTELLGPAHGVLGDLDGVAPPELFMVERTRCDDRSATLQSALQVRRYDPGLRRMMIVAQRVTPNAPREAAHVAALDVTGEPGDELLLCASPFGAGPFPRTCRLFALDNRGSLAPVPDAQRPFVWSSPPRRSLLASVLVDDLDGDGAREIFLQSQEHVDVLRGPRR